VNGKLAKVGRMVVELIALFINWLRKLMSVLLMMVVMRMLQRVRMVMMMLRVVMMLPLAMVAAVV